MVGVLVLSAGIPDAIEDGWLGLATAGYVIMRLGLVASWLRVARDEPAERPRALRFAVGVSVLQVLWVLRLALPPGLQIPSFLVLAGCELLVPVWGEGARDAPLFHADHIEERYGLFTIILLGESVLAAAASFQTAFDEQGLTGGLFAVGVTGMALAFGCWWLYFDHPGHLTPTPDVAFAWGYAHVAVYLPLAALGPGLEVAIDAVSGHAGSRLGALSVALPVAGYLLGLALVMVVTGTPLGSTRVLSKAAGAVVMILCGLVLPLTAAVAACAVIVAVLVTTMVIIAPAPPGTAQPTLSQNS
jgi:low temperature requirement protein LtrA